MQLEEVVARLRASGCVAAEEEAEELMEAVEEEEQLEALLRRRQAGEPLAWLTGRAAFCGLDLAIGAGVYVPRWQSEVLARRAAALLGPGRRGVDLCTGCGAVARVMARTGAEVVATDTSARAVAWARRNGVDARQGDLDEPLPLTWRGRVGVMAAVTPYVPTEELGRLPRDVADHEPRSALDGGPDGLLWLGRVIARAPRWLEPGGRLVVELGRPQQEAVAGLLGAAGFGDIRFWPDPDGDIRAAEGAWPGPGGRGAVAVRRARLLGCWRAGTHPCPTPPPPLPRAGSASTAWSSPTRPGPWGPMPGWSCARSGPCGGVGKLGRARPSRAVAPGRAGHRRGSLHRRLHPSPVGPGAAPVLAVDVGYGQLLGSRRQDPRVANLERTNAAQLTPRSWWAPASGWWWWT